MRTYTSQFYGKPINPPDTPKIVRVAATQEEMDFAVNLHRTTLPGEWRAITRRTIRQFGIMRQPTTIAGWCHRADARDGL